MLRRRSLIALALAAATAPPTRSFAQSAAPSSLAGQLAVIVARDSPLQGLPLADLRALFLGDARTDPKGTKLVPVNLPPGTPDRIAFDRLALGMSPDENG